MDYTQRDAIETVALNNPIPFNSSNSCNCGCSGVYHENGTGTFTLRGGNKYQVTFNGNIAIPDGGDVTPIAVGITVQGESRQSSLAIFTPADAEEFGNVTSTAVISVPCGCCFTIAVEYLDATATDATTTPTPSIDVQNGNLTIVRALN